GGNNSLLQYFGQVQLDAPKDYVVYALVGGGAPQGAANPAARPSRPGVGGHAGEGEIANDMAHRPGLVPVESSATQTRADMNRLDLPQGLYTGIWWYSRFPNHYAGDSSGATAARGTAIMELTVQRIVNAIRAIKADQMSPRLQKEFFDAAQ